MKYILLAIVISACVFYAQGARAEMPPLQPGLNIVGGTGEQPAAYAAHNDCVYAIYSWDPWLKRWSQWIWGAPDYVNNYRPVGQMRIDSGYFVLCIGFEVGVTIPTD